MKVKILIPIYNDWDSAYKLIENIDTVIVGMDEEISVIIVNDASKDLKPPFKINLNNLKSVKIVNMKENRGHARCYAAGFKYINENENFDYIIPMDGDGEDRPEEIKQLIEKAKDFPNTVVTANRIKRSEGYIFKICYLIHKYLTYTFTGQSIKFGNFTCLTKSSVEKMIQEPATWSSFSGSLSKVTKEKKSIPSIRGTRYFGQSKMSYYNLLKHSMSIIAVFKITALVRSIIFLVTYFFLMFQNITLVTLIPILLIILMLIVIFFLSRRENITELNKSLENIVNVESLK